MDMKNSKKRTLTLNRNKIARIQGGRLKRVKKARRGNLAIAPDVQGASVTVDTWKAE